MNLLFNPDEKLQLIGFLDAYANSKDVMMSREEADMFGELIRRIKSPKNINKWKRNQVECLRFLIHQTLEHRETNQEELMKDMDDVEQKVFGMENNIFLLVMEKLNKKLGEDTTSIS